MNKNIRIVFMGTPAFAVSSLQALVDEGFNIVGVVTAPDKPAGRGMKLTQSAVKEYAISKGLQILQPEKLKSPSFLEQLNSLEADLQVVVAFRMLPEVVWNMPPLGTINVHGSLLPQYRGAAPINWAIINGEKETGVTTFKLQHTIDTGNILLQERIPIDENETFGMLHDKMKVIGAQILVKTIYALINNSATETAQSSIPETVLKHAPKIYTDTCIIQWKNSCEEIFNFIRGLSPYPSAITVLDGKKLKIFSAQKEVCHHTYTPGTYQTDKKTFLKYACVDGFIKVTEVQLEGKKKLPVQDFLRGYHFQENN